MNTREASALDLFTDSIRAMGDATLCAVMEFDRQLDPAALERAAQACIRAHPVLHSRLVRGCGPAHWVLEDGAHLPPLVVEECAEDYHPQVLRGIDPYGPLQVRVRLLRKPFGDIIVINLAHAAADGFGLHTLMAQLLQEYAAPGSVPPADGGIPVRDTLWTRSIHAGGDPATSDMRMLDPFWPDPFGTEKGPSSFHRETLQHGEIEAVRRSARAYGGNINDAVLAAYFLAISDLTGHHGPKPVFFPVNLRAHLDDGSRVMSNQSANVSFPLARDAGEGMHGILPRVIRETAALKAGRIGIAEQVGMDAACDPEGEHIRQMVGQMAAQEKNGLADIFISNPGPITLPDTKGLTGAYICYPGGYMPTTCFITSTFRGMMTVTMGYQGNGRAREGTKKAIDLFCGYLRSLGKDPARQPHTPA
jgi:NRPS condensation-like uncharacterized protein